MTRLDSLVRAGAAAVLVTLALTTVSLATSTAPAQASATPFTCNPSLYFQSIATGSNPTQLYEEVYNNTGGITFTQLGSNTGSNYNAIGYDTVNNFLYGAGSGDLVQIDATGTVTDTGIALPQNFISGAFDNSGDYLAEETGGTQAEIYDLNIAGGTATTVPLTYSTGTSFDQILTDWTYSFGYLWSVDPSTNDIVRINLSTGVVLEIPQTFMPSATYGAAWTFGNGNLVFSDNGTGEVYQLAVTNPTGASPTITGVSAAAGMAASTNDGASCMGPAVDLGITKSGPASVAVGSPVSWTLTVTDDSATADSSGFTVTDPVPSGFTSVASTTAGCSVSGNNVTCVEPQLDAGQDLQIAVTATSPAAPSAGSYTNTATVTGNEADPNSSNNTASLTTVVGFANVSLAKVASNATPYPESTDSFTLTAANSVSSTADSGQIVVTDALPVVLHYVSSSAASGVVVASGLTVTWTISDLAPGADTTLTINVQVLTSSPVSNTASFTQAVPDSTGGTSGFSNTVTITPQWANVSLSKSLSSGDSEVGTDDTYTLTASNDADSTAASGQVVVTDVLPTGLAVQSSEASSGTVGVSGQTVTWTIATLAAGASATLQIVVTVNTSSAVDNQATFTQAIPNFSGATTGSSNTVTITPQWADVTVMKTLSSGDSEVGTDDTYTLTASNDVGSTASSGQVVVTDVLPTGLALQSSTATSGTVGVSGQTVTWKIATLAAGGSATLQIVVTVNTTSVVANQATFTQAIPSSSGDTTGSSNTVTFTPQWANVSLSKSLSSGDSDVGTQDTFTLTAASDAGSTASSGQVVVTDPLPAGLSYSSATASSGTVSVSGQTVTWTLANLVPGGSETLSLVVTVDTTSVVDNTASFTQIVPNSLGQTSGQSQTVSVTPVYADVQVTKSASSFTPVSGTDDTFELVATDNGPDGAGQVVVTDAVPTELTVEAVSAGGGSVGVTGQTITWTITSLGVGAANSANLEITVRVTGTNAVTNTATFTQTTPNSTGGTTGNSQSVALTPQSPPASGYQLAGADGGVFALGGAPYEGSLPGLGLHVWDIVGLTSTDHGDGYWLVGSDGGVFAFGTAAYEGSLPGLGIHVHDIVGIRTTADGKGYWLVGADGAVYTFGSALYEGSLPGDGIHVHDIVALRADPDDHGYWLVGSDGGVFAFGSAPYEGSLPGDGIDVNDIVGMDRAPDGAGYLLAGADGGAFAFGSAVYQGSLPGDGIDASDIEGVAADGSGQGYALVGAEGGVFTFGDFPYEGSLPGLGIHVNDIVGIHSTTAAGT